MGFLDKINYSMIVNSCSDVDHIVRPYV